MRGNYRFLIAHAYMYGTNTRIRGFCSFISFRLDVESMMLVMVSNHCVDDGAYDDDYHKAEVTLESDE